MTSAAISGTSGKLLDISIQSDDEQTVGAELDASLSELTFTTTTAVEVPFTDVDFTITIGEEDDGYIEFYETSATLPKYTAGETGDVRMFRTIVANQWNTIVLPFTLTKTKAEAAFVAAGCEKDAEGFWCRNGERISFTINATPGDQVRIDMAQIAAQQLQQAGLDVKANVPADGIDWGGQECCIIGWGSPYDADDHTYKVFSTDAGANYSGYSNAEVDEWLKKARQTDDPNERAECYKQFQIAMAKAPAYTFFAYIDAMFIADSNIKGIDANTVLGHHGVGIFWNVTEWTME